jgi:hypothetical protein
MPGSPRSAQSPSPDRARRRWLAWAFAAIAAAIALWALSAGPCSAPPLDDIGPASREQLDEALREGESEPVR